MFRIQKPKFTNPSITSKAKDINITPVFIDDKQHKIKNGEEIWNEHFGSLTLLPDFSPVNLEHNWLSYLIPSSHTGSSEQQLGLEPLSISGEMVQYVSNVIMRSFVYKV